MRATRLLFVLFAIVGASVAFTSTAQALTVPGFTWVVPCDDPDGVATNEVVTDLFMAGGTYLVTTAGVCSIDVRFQFGATTSTPCGTTTTGPLPCATTTVQNLPGQLCWESLLYVTVEVCRGPGGPDGTGVSPNSCATEFGVAINDQCLPLGGAGLVTMPSVGAMRAKFRDSVDPAAYADNGGHFVVTAVLTAL